MIVAFVISALFATLALAIIITCMTVQDIRIAKIVRGQRRHPHARKWRMRPFVTIILDDHQTPDSLASIRKSSYRNIRFAIGSTEQSAFVVHLPDTAVLPRQAIKEAVLAMNGNPAIASLPLFPRLTTPSTLHLFFRNYRILLFTPLASVYALTGSSDLQSVLPFLSRTDTTAPTRRRVIKSIVWFTRSIISGLCIYACVLAVTSLQPMLLLTYIAAFGLWTLWAIASYPGVRLQTKIMYLFLLPAVLPYATYRLVTLPLARPLYRLRGRKVLS